jgi:hypothetical protein
VRFLALPHFLRSSGSGTGSTQPRENNCHLKLYNLGIHSDMKYTANKLTGANLCRVLRIRCFGFKTIQFGETPTFRTKMSPSSISKNKPSNEQEDSGDKHGVLLDVEDGIVLVRNVGPSPNHLASPRRRYYSSYCALRGGELFANLTMPTAALQILFHTPLTLSSFTADTNLMLRAEPSADFTLLWVVNFFLCVPLSINNVREQNVLQTNFMRR